MIGVTCALFEATPILVDSKTIGGANYLLIGARIRHSAFISSLDVYRGQRLGIFLYPVMLIAGLVRVLAGRPSFRVATASISYRDGLTFLAERIEERDDGETLRLRLLRFAAEDADAANRSVRASFAISYVAMALGLLLSASTIGILLSNIYSGALLQFLIIFALAAIFVVVAAPRVATNLSGREPVLWWMLGSWTAATLLLGSTLGFDSVFVQWRTRETSILERVAVATATMAVVTALSIAVLALTAWFIDRVRSHYLLRTHPFSTALFEIVFAGTLVDSQDAASTTLYRRFVATECLNYAATAVRVGFGPRWLGNLPTRASVSRRVRSAAFAIDKVGETVMIGTCEARATAINSLRDAAIAILLQSYSDLPKLDEAEEEAWNRESQKALRRRLLVAASDLGIGAVPLLVVMAVRAFAPSIPAEATNALTTLAVGWLLVKALQAFDSGYRETLSDARAMGDELKR